MRLSYKMRSSVLGGPHHKDSTISILGVGRSVHGGQRLSRCHPKPLTLKRDEKQPRHRCWQNSHRPGSGSDRLGLRV